MFHQEVLVTAAVFPIHHPHPIRFATAASSLGQNSDVRRRHSVSPTAIKSQYFNFAAQQSFNPTQRYGEAAAATDLAAQLSVASRLRVDETFAALEGLSVKGWKHTQGF